MVGAAAARPETTLCFMYLKEGGRGECGAKTGDVVVVNLAADRNKAGATEVSARNYTRQV